MPRVDVPQYHEMLYPMLLAVQELGGSGSISEIGETVIAREGYTEAQQSVLHLDGPETEILYRLAWGRTYLKGMGYLTNSARGVWALTDAGRALLTDSSLTEEQKRERIGLDWAHYAASVRARPRKKTASTTDKPSEDPDEAMTWRELLLDTLMRMSPGGFERLAQRLLREADFDSVTVTGRAGDGGIDGVGVYRLGLVSFPVFFQCKRYKGSVGPDKVRDFRGAMAGRGDKELLITTGTFTAEARREATRDCAPPIDLIDGERLAELLKRYELGVATRVEQVKHVTVDQDFYQRLST